jgi:hypothetical protein
MSKGIDYSKFDGIDTDSDEEVGTVQQSIPAEYAAASTAAMQPPGTQPPTGAKPPPQQMTKKGKEGRYKFEYEGRTIYEWDQNLNEVNIYIDPPPDVPRNVIDIKITHRHLTVGLKNTPPFIDEDTGGAVKVNESLWTLSDGEININLQKMNKAEMWTCALAGRHGSEVDAYTQEEVKKQLMLERFQEEHPTFDFSGAEFNGEVPSAREFMGGVKYS